MWLSRVLAAATLVASALAQNNCDVGIGNCATIWSTGNVCSTCIVKACLQLSTITTPSGCPPDVCTRTTSYPCAGGVCPDGCASTSYIYPGTPITNVGCPTVYEVLGPRCSRCPPGPSCTTTSTISSKCGCPRAPTIITSYECPECGQGCHHTDYVYETAVPNCDGGGGAGRCTPTVTVTEHPGTTGGCKFDCSPEFCIMDKFVELPCGCTSADHVVTVTDTKCATKSPCWNCHSGFPFTTTSSGCGSPPPPTGCPAK